MDIKGPAPAKNDCCSSVSPALRGLRPLGVGDADLLAASVAAMNDGLFWSTASRHGDKCPDAVDRTLSRLSTAPDSTARLYSYPAPLFNVPLEVCLLKLRFPGDPCLSASEDELDDAPVAASSAAFFFTGGGGFSFGVEFFWNARDAPWRAVEADDDGGGFMSRREARDVRGSSSTRAFNLALAGFRSLCLSTKRVPLSK